MTIKEVKEHYKGQYVECEIYRFTDFTHRVHSDFIYTPDDIENDLYNENEEVLYEELMDDANVPSLLAMPYLGDVECTDPIYENTRRFVWSTENPYFWRGAAGEGIGGPHIGVEMIWPMSIMMRAFTSTDDEIRDCIVALMTTDAGTGFMHESFSRHDAANFTRPWFAWQNTLFGELVLKLVNEGKVDLLNSIN